MARLGLVTPGRQVPHLLLADRCAGVVGPDEVGVDPEPGLGAGGAEVVEDGVVVGERLAGPVLAERRIN